MFARCEEDVAGANRQDIEEGDDLRGREDEVALRRYQGRVGRFGYHGAVFGWVCFGDGAEGT